METLTLTNQVSSALEATSAAAHVAAQLSQQQHQQELLQQHHHHQQSSHSPVLDQQQQQQQQHQHALVNLSDMELPQEIHEDIVTIPKEMILISLVSQEQALYNPKHEHYRNTTRKDTKWLEIADSVGWAEPQCKAKWKAMRDQYCRELKRSKFNARVNVKWKYFKELDFLRPYALSRNYRPRNTSISSSNNNNNNNLNISATTTTTSNNNQFTSNNNNNNSGGASSNSLLASATTAEIKFPHNIKIEAGVHFNPCEFITTSASSPVGATTTTTGVAMPAQIKSETAVATARLLTTLTDEQLSSVMQQQQQDGNWNYLTASTTTTTPSGVVSATVATQSQQQQSAADDVLYSAFVDCVTAAAGQMQQQQQLQQMHAQTEEEDDDNIHTYLNIESYFEKELIAMIQQEDILYNSFHTNYRNVKLKMEVWDEIARKLKKTVKQCRLKWKALRDQYIREHKRLKNRENAESLPRWKHYDALNFLHKFIKHKNDFEASKNVLQIPKTELDDEMTTDADEQQQQQQQLLNSGASPLHSPLDGMTTSTQQQQHASLQSLQILPSLTGPHAVAAAAVAQQQLQQALQQQQQQQQLHSTDSLNCGYDEMDIDNYIIGTTSEEPHDEEDEEIIEDEDRKSQQHFPDFTNNTNTNTNTNTANNSSNNANSQNNNTSNEQLENTNEEEMEDDDEEEDEDEDDDDGDEEEDEQEELDFKDIKSPQLQEQHLPQQQQQQQQTAVLAPAQQMMAVDVVVETLHNNANNSTTITAPEHDFSAETQHTTASSSLLLNGGSGGSNIAADCLNIAATLASSTNAIATPMPTPTPTPTPAAVAVAVAANEDDEVGAFFRAVAMKIRNAKMSPVAFTDLQIDILRVINGTLRHH